MLIIAGIIIIFFLILSIFWRHRKAPAILVKLAGNGYLLTEVISSSDFQASFEKIIELRVTNGIKSAPRAHLTLENDSKVNSKAVRVSIDGFTVGYLSRSVALQFRREVNRGGYAGTFTFECPAVIRHGWSRGYTDSANHIAFVELPHLWPD